MIGLTLHTQVKGLASLTRGYGSQAYRYYDKRADDLLVLQKRTYP